MGTNTKRTKNDTIKWNITLGSIKKATVGASKQETKWNTDGVVATEDIAKKENAENTTGKNIITSETLCSHDSTCDPSVFMIIITKLSKLFDIAKNCCGT